MLFALCAMCRTYGAKIGLSFSMLHTCRSDGAIIDFSLLFTLYSLLLTPCPLPYAFFVNQTINILFTAHSPEPLKLLTASF